MSARATLWQRIVAQRFEHQPLVELARWIVEHRNALIHGGDEPSDPRPGWVGGSDDPDLAGPRCFLKFWQAGECTERHTHPNGMLIVVLEGALHVDEGWDEQNEQRTTLKRGEWHIRLAESDGFEHFPHVIRCTQDSISLHLYSDAPNRGRTVSG